VGPNGPTLGPLKVKTAPEILYLNSTWLKTPELPLEFRRYLSLFQRCKYFRFWRPYYYCRLSIVVAIIWGHYLWCRCCRDVMLNNFRYTDWRPDCCILYPIIHIQEKSRKDSAQCWTEFFTESKIELGAFFTPNAIGEFRVNQNPGNQSNHRYCSLDYCYSWKVLWNKAYISKQITKTQFQK